MLARLDVVGEHELALEVHPGFDEGRGSTRPDQATGGQYAWNAKHRTQHKLGKSNVANTAPCERSVKY